MESTWNYYPTTSQSISSASLLRLASATQKMREKAAATGECRLGPFKKITHKDMETIWPYLSQEKGRTTDFSYAGVLMWVDYFKYEYCVYDDTLFIKGVVESDLSKPAFSLPVGKLPLSESVELLKEYCKAHNLDLEFSAVPAYAIDEMKALSPVRIEDLTDWADYLYESDKLATLVGKKMSKKRNHVNQFLKNNDNWEAVAMTPENASEAMAFMDIFDQEGDDTEMAAAERELSRNLISLLKEGDTHLKGMILRVDGKTAAYTIGDVKGDTLFVHVEKATRLVPNSYEMINYMFAKTMTEENPDILYINREDDAGDIGLRMAKESYHPVEMLKKYNVIF